MALHFLSLTLVHRARIVGGNDGPIGDAEEATNRAENNIPEIQVEILPKAGHLMNTEEPEFVNDRILEFLE